MKKVILFLVLSISCLLSFADDFEVIQFDLGDLYYDQDIITTGIDQTYDFYFPIVHADTVKDAHFKFFYEFTQISGPDAMYVLMVNEKPVITDYFKEQKGEISISIPSELIEINTMAKITLHITLDYSVCDQLRLNKNALWFRLKKQSFFEFAYSEKGITSIPLFLSPMNPDRKYELIVNEPQKQSQAVVAMGQYMGYLSRGLKRDLELRQSASGFNNVILFEESQGTFSLTEKTLHLPVELEEQFDFDYISILPSSSMTVTQLNTKADKRVSRSFSQLGINDFRSDIVYNNRTNRERNSKMLLSLYMQNFPSFDTSERALLLDTLPRFSNLLTVDITVAYCDNSDEHILRATNFVVALLNNDHQFKRLNLLVPNPNLALLPVCEALAANRKLLSFGAWKTPRHSRSQIIVSNEAKEAWLAMLKEHNFTLTTCHPMGNADPRIQHYLDLNRHGRSAVRGTVTPLRRTMLVTHLMDAWNDPILSPHANRTQSIMYGLLRENPDLWCHIAHGNSINGDTQGRKRKHSLV